MTNNSRVKLEFAVTDIHLYTLQTDWNKFWIYFKKFK